MSVARGLHNIRFYGLWYMYYVLYAQFSDFWFVVSQRNLSVVNVLKRRQALFAWRYGGRKRAALKSAVESAIHAMYLGHLNFIN